LPPDLGRYPDHANYLLHLIVRGRVFWLDEETGYTRLKVTYLRKVIPDNVEKRLRGHLIEAGVGREQRRRPSSLAM
jgi:hypothetical protein